jgi:cytochrome c peroxidase
MNAGSDRKTPGLPASHAIGEIPAAPNGEPLRRRWAWLGLALLSFAGAAPAQTPNPPTTRVTPAANQEPITPIPPATAADPRKVELGQQLFQDRRFSHHGALACISCHDIHTNGTDDGQQTTTRAAATRPLRTLTVFNAALSFRLNWEGNIRTLEDQVESSLENPTGLATSADEVIRKLNADPRVVAQFNDAYGRRPDRAALLDAIATYERSLLTPGSRFDRWLDGDSAALTKAELGGYTLFQSLGCVACHQGVNVGGNLFERHGIFRPLASPQPEILRVPGLRNVATRAPYFHDGSAPTLAEAVRQMAAAQLNRVLTGQEVDAIVAFLNTLTGTYRGVPVVATSP